MVALVQDMLDLHKRLPEAQNPTDRTIIERRIQATDEQIDALVYELYGLTEEEIALVKAGTSQGPRHAVAGDRGMAIGAVGSGRVTTAGRLRRLPSRPPLASR